MNRAGGEKLKEIFLLLWAGFVGLYIVPLSSSSRGFVGLWSTFGAGAYLLYLSTECALSGEVVD